MNCNYNEKNIINSKDTIKIIKNTLNLIDSRLIEHGERVGYILYNIIKDLNYYDEKFKIKIFLLGLFHDIGAYKTDEIDKMIIFETDSYLNHSVYGHLFIKHFTPLSDLSEAILYHHMDYSILKMTDCTCKPIANLINLSDRIDIYLRSNNNFDFNLIKKHENSKFSSENINLFNEQNLKHNIVDKILSGEYLEELNNFYDILDFNDSEIEMYLKMLAFSIDFRSFHTVTHTINTVSFSVEIAKLLNLNKKQMYKIYYGSLLHDIGKISTPISILEFPGKLTFEEMQIMKLHVSVTRDILQGFVDDEICKIASRHHEKIDGSGYPDGINGDSLSVSERIVAIADILSALNGQRSYKEVFLKDKTIRILKSMSENNKICPIIAELVIKNYDELVESASIKVKPIIDTYLNIKNEFNSTCERLIKYNSINTVEFKENYI